MENYVITIGRQWGAGGSVMGKRLAEHFGFRYIDKEILVKAAEIQNTSAERLADIDERGTKIGNILMKIAIGEVPYMADEWYEPTSSKLFEVQSEIMQEAVAKEPCVIIGRCGSHIFREHENHIGFFLRADTEARLCRMEKELGEHKTRRQLLKLIETEDRDRAKYYMTYTGARWLDVREYDMTLDTTPFSDDQTEEILLRYITTRFPELK